MARITSLPGAPWPIEQHASPNHGGPMIGHRGLVLHMAQGSYAGTIAWQRNPNQRYSDGTSVTTSSTWIIGKAMGEWAQMVDTDTIAWCQRGGSLEWLSVELAGFTPAAPTPWQIDAVARLLVWANGHYGIPLQVAADPGQRGLGHHAMDREWMGEEWGHEACPGVGVVKAKSGIVQRAITIREADMTPEEAWGIEYPDYVENEKGAHPSINTKHALFSARRDAWLAREGVRELLDKGMMVQIDYDLLAGKVADRLGALRFEPTNDTNQGDVLPPA